MATMAPAMAEIVSGKLKDSEQTAKEEKKRGVFFFRWVMDATLDHPGIRHDTMGQN